jgi:hypothetical protein
LFHGDIVRNGGCGIHLDNILYDDVNDVFYIIDFNSKNNIINEIKVKSNMGKYCPILKRKRNCKSAY